MSLLDKFYDSLQVYVRPAPQVTVPLGYLDVTHVSIAKAKFILHTFEYRFHTPLATQRQYKVQLKMVFALYHQIQILLLSMASIQLTDPPESLNGDGQQFAQKLFRGQNRLEPFSGRWYDEFREKLSHKSWVCHSDKLRTIHEFLNSQFMKLMLSRDSQTHTVITKHKTHGLRLSSIERLEAVSHNLGRTYMFFHQAFDESPCYPVQVHSFSEYTDSDEYHAGSQFIVAIKIYSGLLQNGSTGKIMAWFKAHHNAIYVADAVHKE